MNWKLFIAAGWTLLIIALCSMPGSSLPSPNIVGLDKFVHFMLFGVFGWLWVGILSDRSPHAVGLVFMAGLLLAGLTEVYQGLLPFGRQPSFADAGANTVGLVVGIGVQFVLRRQEEPAA